MTQLEIIKELIKIVLTSDNKKLVKSSVQLFNFQNSPVLIEFIKNTNLALWTLSKIDTYNMVQLGHLSKFFVNALNFEETKELTKNALETLMENSKNANGEVDKATMEKRQARLDALNKNDGR